MQELISYIQKAVIEISNILKFPDTAYAQSQNITGDKQLKLDILSDTIITKTLSQCPSIKALISEEKDGIFMLNEGGKFIVAYDPLDGSSVFDANFAVGSIFGIYEQEAVAKNLKASLYSIYATRLDLVICQDKAQLYRLNPNNEFVFIKDIKMQNKGKINATGGSQKFWKEEHALFIKNLFDEGYRLRYSGAMVSDVHQILIKEGGIFSYPQTSDLPRGKLRLLFEVLPLALIVEKSGGRTTDGKNNSLLELEFDGIDATTPCFLGSQYEITKLLKAYNG